MFRHGHFLALTDITEEINLWSATNNEEGSPDSDIGNQSVYFQDIFEEPSYKRLARCPYLPANSTLDSLNIFKQPFKSIRSHFMLRSRQILKQNLAARILVIFQCEFDLAVKDETTPIGRYFKETQEQKAPPPSLCIRDFLRGGESAYKITEKKLAKIPEIQAMWRYLPCFRT